MRVTASFGSGFLLAVLWFDLMFDVQIGHRSRQPRDEALDSIAGYYRRVTTTSRPMSALVAAVMVVTLAALTGEVAAGDSPRWAAMSSLGLVALAVAIAAARTVRSAARLGAGIDTRDRQGALARSIYREHVVCLVAIAVTIVLQLVFA